MNTQAAAALRNFLAILLLGALGPTLVMAGQGHRCLRVFDGTGYSDKPDLDGVGIEPTYIFEPDRWWPPGKGDDDLPSPAAVDHWMREIANKKGRVILDVERWPLVGSDADVRESVRRYATIAGWLRTAGYDRPLGYYNVVPIWDRASALQPRTSAAHRQWQAHDDLMRPLLDQVGALYPSLYTDSDDIGNWIEFADAHIAEARRIANGKPIYVFIWPQFHESNRVLGLQYLPVSMWLAELQWASDHADGVVIWGGWDSVHNRPSRWDESAPWWAATKRFLEVTPPCAKLGA